MKLVLPILLFLLTSSYALASNRDLTWDEANSICPNGTVHFRSHFRYHYCHCCQRGTTKVLTTYGVVCKANAEDMRVVNEKWGHLSGGPFKDAMQMMMADPGVKCSDLKSGKASEKVRWESNRDYGLKAKQEKEETANRTDSSPSVMSDCKYVGSDMFYDRIIICDSKAYGSISFEGTDKKQADDQLSVACRATIFENRNTEEHCVVNEEYGCCYLGDINPRKNFYQRLQTIEEISILNQYNLAEDDSGRVILPEKQTKIEVSSPVDMKGPTKEE